MEDPVVVVVELPEGGRVRAVLDSTGGGVGVDAGGGSGVDAGAATVFVVAMAEETGSSNAAALMTECIPTGSKSGSSS